MNESFEGVPVMEHPFSAYNQGRTTNMLDKRGEPMNSWNIVAATPKIGMVKVQPVSPRCGINVGRNRMLYWQ